MVSSLDRVSNGRFLFGVGNGWNQDEIENHGTDFKTRHKLGRERIEAMKTIWTEDEPEYHGEFVNIEKMNQWPKPVQKPHPPIIVGGAFPYAARRAIRYGNGWIPRADRLEKDGIGVLIDKFRDMAKAAGRDPAELPITIFRVPEDLTQLRFCEEIGIDRIVFTLPAEKSDKIMPILDRWSAIKARTGDLNGGVDPIAVLRHRCSPGKPCNRRPPRLHRPAFVRGRMSLRIRNQHRRWHSRTAGLRPRVLQFGR